VILLGETPTRAITKIFEKHEVAGKIAMALRGRSRVAMAHNLTIQRPLSFQMSTDSYLDVWISNWPRGEGYKTVPHDITRALVVLDDAPDFFQEGLQIALRIFFVTKFRARVN